MPEIEELEHRITRVESLYEGVLKDRITQIASRLDQIFEKTEHNKTEILTKTEKDKSEILAKIEEDKSEILTKTEKDKREIIYWMVGSNVGFLTLTIKALGAILSFALRR
jgi:archaellum component FlaC